MLGFLLSQLKNLFWSDNGSANNSNPSEDKDNVDERTLYGYRTHPRVGGNKLTVENNVCGMITNVDETLATGVVDGCMDFSLTNCHITKSENIVYDEDLPPIGSQVILKRERLSRLDRWTITEMKIVSVPQLQNTIWVDLDENGDSNSQEKAAAPVLYRKEMGMVTHVRRDTAILNGELEFPLDVCDDGFWVEAGDYIIIEFDKDKLEKEGMKIVCRVSPLRCLDYEGTISFYKTNHGFINRKISFRSRAIKTENFYPCRDDRVYGSAIESVHSRDINFRAISVFKKSTNGGKNCSSTNEKLLLKPSRPLNSLELVRDMEAIGLEFKPPFLNFGKIGQGQIMSQRAVLKNKSSETGFTILSIHFDSVINDQFKLVETSVHNCNFDEAFLLEVESELELTIHATGLYPGYDEQILVIEFMNEEVKQAIGLTVSAQIVDPSELTFVGIGRGRAGLLRTPPKGKSSGPGSSTAQSPTFIMPGVKPSVVAAQAVSYMPHKMKRYAIPPDLRRRVEGKEDLVSDYLPSLSQALTWSNYMSKLDCLVHLEEISEEESMKEFDMFDARLDRRGEYLCVEIPGLNEGRPSLIIGDKVKLGVQSEEHCVRNLEYEGYIHEIHREVVLLKFHPSFHASYRGQCVDVSFTYSRTPYRRMHQAIEYAHRLGKQILFPSHLLPQSSQCLINDPVSGERQFTRSNYESREQEDLRKLQFHNAQLNSRQQAAVVRILHGYSRPTPYILFGPPGTGKTVTLVESILQVYQHVPSSRILACAPSNSAADLLCLRLHESGVLDPSDMARLNSFRRSTVSAVVGEEVAPSKILPYCYGPDKLSDVAMHRIVICTCVSSGSLFSLGLAVGHFTHAFVDEAGQAMEPECIIPLALVAASSGQIILAGDPQQLGPVIMSSQAEKYGLGESFLYRLLNSCTIYSRKSSMGGNLGQYDPLVITKLVHNYRSHPSLLELPSRLFYDNELLPCAPDELVNCCQNWRGLVHPELGHPLVFHGVRGQELRDGNSPSWFNPTEAVLILKYVGMILQDSEMLNIKATDIGIITPYRKQVEKLRHLLNSGLNISISHHDSIKIGSVEEFQGQERRVILISTVRCDQSSSGLISENSSWMTGLNFLCKPGRFNVAVTRANALVIVVGDPFLLCRDSQWRALIRHCHKLGCYTGCDVTGIADFFT